MIDPFGKKSLRWRVSFTTLAVNAILFAALVTFALR